MAVRHALQSILVLSLLGAAACGGEPPSVPVAIEGTGYSHYVQEDGGTQLAPRDYSNTGITAWEPSPDGGYYGFQASGTDAGTFAVEPVRTPYLLQHGRTYVWTSAHAVNLSFTYAGRLNVQEATAGTTLALNASNLSPWQEVGGVDQDGLQLTAFNAGVTYFDFSCSGSTPGAGVTSFSGSITTANLQACGNFAGLINAAAGDRTYVTQLVGRTVATGAWFQELRRGYTGALTQYSGGYTSFNAPLQVLGGTTTRTFDVRTADFRTLALQAGPGATMDAMEFNIGALPGYGAHGRYTGWPDLVYGRLDRTATNSVVPTEYANPFPASWEQFARAYATSSVPFSVPLGSTGTTTPTRVSATVAADVTLGALGAAPLVLQPQVGPPRALTVGGRAAADVPVTGVGLLPQLGWSAPATGTPTVYVVRLYELSNNGSNGTQVSAARAWLYTPETSVRLPPGLLASGKHYFVRVTALVAPRWSDARPFQTWGDVAYADALSTRFSP